MKKSKYLFVFWVMLVLNNNVVFAQSKIKDGTVNGSANLPDADAVAEFESSNKGVLLSRVALTASNAAAPLSAFVTGMIVYNTATAGTAPNQVTPGYYYCDGTKWVRLTDAKTPVDSTNDGWKDDAANARVMLAYQSNGSTARTAGTEFVIKDNGLVGIGTATPSARLDVKGTVRIDTVKNVGEDIPYRTLVWNTTTKKVEAFGENGNTRKKVNLASGSSSSFYTLSVGSTGAYNIMVKVANNCAATSYNQFVAVGSNFNNVWVINFIGGMSAEGPPTVTRPNNTTVATVNPVLGCADGGDASSLNYTLAVNAGTGALTLTNNGNIGREYEIIVEEIFN